MSSPSSPPVTTPPVTIAYIDETDLQSGNYGKPLILNKIFNSILVMLQALQDATAAQASRLTFLTQWQQAYTDLMNAVHTFTVNDGDALQSASSTDRQEINNNNSTYLTRMQNSQSLIQDDAKALQSNIDQSNNEVNQQSNLATSILQEMSTIISSIFSKGGG